MRSIAAFGQRWKRAIGASLTLALLSAVAVVGITLFGSEVLAAWKTPENAEQALSSVGALAGTLNFEAAAETTARFQTEKKEAARVQTSSGPMLAKNWKFTQNSIVDFLQNTYIEGIQLQMFAILLDRFIPNSPLTAFAFTFTNSWLQTADAFLAVLRLPPVPTISPFF